MLVGRVTYHARLPLPMGAARVRRSVSDESNESRRVFWVSTDDGRKTHSQAQCDPFVGLGKSASSGSLENLFPLGQTVGNT